MNVLLLVLQHIAILISLAAVYAWVSYSSRKNGVSVLVENLQYGLTIGLCAIAAMSIPFQIRNNVIFDSSAVILGIGGLFAGPIGAGIASILAISFLTLIGSSELLASILVVLVTATMGVFYYQLRKKELIKVTPVNLAIFGMLLCIAVEICFAIIPGIEQQTLRPGISLLLVLIFLLVTTSLGWIVLGVESWVWEYLQLHVGELRYRSYFELDNIGRVEISVQRKIRQANRYFRDLLGYTEAELENLTWSDLTHPDGSPDNLREYHKLVSGTQEAYTIEKKLKHKDGRCVETILSSRAIRGPDGRPEFILKSIQDISELRQLEAKLRASEVRFRDIVEQSITGIFLMEDGRFIYHNDRLCEMFGYSPDEFAKLNSPIDLIDPEYVQEYVKHLGGSEELGEETAVDLKGVNKDGTQFWISIFFSMTIIEGKHLVSATVLDIDQAKSNEMAVQQATKMHAIGQLTGGIAHDFNNMLNIIRGNIELIESIKGIDEEDSTRPMFEDCLSAIHEATEITRRLNSFSRSSPANTQLLCINELVSGFENFLRRSLGETITLAIDLAPSQSLAEVDKNQFENALLNLVVNARDAMNGSGKLDISIQNVEISAAQVKKYAAPGPGNYVELKVSDTGAGMPEAIAARIFEPFFTTKAVGKGTGLGLSMVYGFADSVQGFCRVSSRVGTGTAMSIFLPQKTGSKTEVAGTEPKYPVKAGLETILIVEDNTKLLSVASKMISNMGYQALAVESAELAVLILETNTPVDLVFSDIRMPGAMNGISLADWILAHYPKTKVLLTSGFYDSGDQGQSSLEHSYPQIPKPYSQGDLSNTIREILDNA